MKKIVNLNLIQMFLLNLPYELLQTIFLWLPENKDTISLATVNREWNDLAKNNGYLRKLSFSQKTISMMNWVNLFGLHSRVIDRVYVENVNNPHYFIIEFPRIVNCYECDLTEAFIPNGGRPCDTEVLIYRNMSRETSRTFFRTDWSLFPKLKRIVIYTWTCDITGLGELAKLGNLKTVCIYTHGGSFKRNF